VLKHTFFIVCCGLLIAFSAMADDTLLPAPESNVLLTISGNITNRNIESDASMPKVELDMPMLESLGATRFNTTTPWTEGLVEFVGVRVSSLLDFVGARSAHLTLVGLDGYSIDIKTVDFERYPVVVAYKKNNRGMSVRDLGPLWFMFPFTEYPELLNETNKAGAVWQLTQLVVR